MASRSRFLLHHAQPSERWWWSIYVDDSEITEILRRPEAERLEGTISDRHAALRAALQRHVKLNFG